jgi:hypothetical protein
LSVGGMEAKIDRLEYLRSRIAEAYQSGAISSDLGDLALEILILRSELEESRTPESKKMLDELRELEKSLISIYLLTRLGRERRVFSRTYSYSVFHRVR